MTMNKAVVKIYIQTFVQEFSVPSDEYQGAQRIDHKTATVASKMAVPFVFPQANGKNSYPSTFSSDSVLSLFEF